MYSCSLYLKNMDDWVRHAKYVVNQSDEVTDNTIEKIFSFHFDIACQSDIVGDNNG